MMSPAQILMFNQGCCDSCIPVSISGSQPAYVEPMQPPFLVAAHVLNGTGPFEVVSHTTLFEFIDFTLSGNVMNIRFDTRMTTIFETGVAYPITYTVRNCNGAEATYNGTVTINP